MPVAERSRDYVGVRGPDAEDFLQRMLSNDVTQAPCDALLLTAKGRIVAPLRVLRRGDDDFLLLTEPGLGEAVRTTLLRARFAAKCEIEPEEHRSVLVWDGDFSSAEEQLDADTEPTRDRSRRRARADRGGRPGVGGGDRRLHPPGRGGSRPHAHLVHQGLLSGTGAGRAPALPRAREPRPARAQDGRAARRRAALRGKDRRPRDERRSGPRARLREGRSARGR